MKTLVSISCVLLSFSCFAVDCETAFKDTSYTDKNDLTMIMQLASASERCSSEAGGKGSKKAGVCAGKAFLKLANSGNYVAAEHLARNYCLENKKDDAKAMLNSIINNPLAPQYVKDRSVEALKILNN